MKKTRHGFYRAESAEERVDGMKKAVDAYGNMTPDELLDELFAQAAAARRRGELDDSGLDKFYASVKDFLGAEQRKRLDVLIDALKRK